MQRIAVVLVSLVSVGLGVACGGSGGAVGRADGGGLPFVDAGVRADGGSPTTGAVGDPCTDDTQCGEGGACLTDLPGGYCTRTACDATECPAGSTCFDVGGTETACFKTCADANECRTSEGYTCDADSTCYPAETPSDGGTGSGAVGDACTANNQCAGGRCFTSLPDGYCTVMGCSDASPCPTGSTCFSVGNDMSACFKNCASETDCRSGYICDSDMTCYTEPTATDGGTPTTGPCSATNRQGSCPSGQVCQNGACGAIACDTGRLEPNQTRETAVALPATTTDDLTLCASDRDWYSIAVPPQKILTVGIKYAQGSGDLDMQAYTSAGQCLGNRYANAYCGTSYPRDYEINEEYLSFFNGAASGDKSYAVQVQGRTTTVANTYTLSSQTVPWADGRDCAEVDSSTPCNGGGSLSNVKLVQFPFADPSDPYVGDGYRFDTMSNYRWMRRELAMLVRFAIKEVQTKFPNTKPLGLIDMCQHDGITPGYDVNDPRHPESTHDQGGNVDIAYYTTLASEGSLAYNEARIICGPTESGSGSNNDGSFCTSAATTGHVVDLPRQVYFMAKLMESPRLRVIGADRVIAPLLRTEATRQQGLGWITAAAAQKFTSRMASGDGWPFHHHHIHVSLNWWGSGKPDNLREERAGCGFELMKSKHRVRADKGELVSRVR